MFHRRNGFNGGNDHSPSHLGSDMRRHWEPVAGNEGFRKMEQLLIRNMADNLRGNAWAYKGNYPSNAPMRRKHLTQRAMYVEFTR